MTDSSVDIVEIEALPIEDEAVNSPPNLEENDVDSRTVLLKPIFVVVTIVFIWVMYVYGLIFLLDKDEARISLSQPLSPPLRSWYFYTFMNWPSCEDVRMETSRLFTYQFVHASPLHIAGNTVAALSYGLVFNLYMGSWDAGIVYVLATFMGSLGHSLVLPFKGLIGCSPGVYGLIGACWVLLFFHYRKLDGPVAFVLPFVLVGQLVGDIVAYLFFYSSSIGYSSHFFGYFTGITVSLALLLLEFRNGRFPQQPEPHSWLTLCSRKTAGLVGAVSFCLVAAFLVHHYAASATPQAVQSRFLRNTGEEAKTCCAQLFAYASNNGISVSEAREETYCSYDQLYQLNR